MPDLRAINLLASRQDMQKSPANVRGFVFALLLKMRRQRLRYSVNGAMFFAADWSFTYAVAGFVYVNGAALSLGFPALDISGNEVGE